MSRFSAGSVLEVSLAEWQRIFAVNVTGMFLVAQTLLVDGGLLCHV